MANRILAVLTILPILFGLKITPLPSLNTTNFKSTVGCDLQTLLETGTPDNKILFILFKIPNCQFCQQATIFFSNTYIEYHKRLILQSSSSDGELERNIMFAEIDCNDSPLICQRFNVPHYPYHNIVEENGDVCVYEGGQLPNEMIDYLSQRKQGNKYEKCRFVGKLTFLTKMLVYLDPIIKLANYNSLLFIIAFMVGPFLFGFIFSRNKKGKEEKLQELDNSSASKAQKSQ